jgi:2-amino-1-hydroxyethylphosphonate dioxygenase (glycine-forming)
MEKQLANKRAEEIFELYEKFGNQDYIGEPVSQLEHMCQAAQLAESEGYDNEVVLAAFLHDVGHLLPVHDESESMNGFGTIDHEKIGAYYLSKLGFSEKMCSLIASHVNAKRYLTFKYPDYYNKLSEASRQTLEFQGGIMSLEEATTFESDDLFPLYIKMRQWDEDAKIEHQSLPPIEKYKEMMIQHLVKQPQLRKV